MFSFTTAKYSDPLNLRIAISVVIYCLAVSAVPIYNKRLLDGEDIEKFEYPVALAGLQLGAVAILCTMINIIQHFESDASGKSSWLLGSHFVYKFRNVAPVGVLFGVKYAITNWGLDLVDTGTHLLLQSTDLLWTVGFARILNSEYLDILSSAAVLLSSLGSILIGAQACDDLKTPFVPLLVNLLTPVFLALCITTLRKGTKELMRKDNICGGVSAFEFTAMKLFLSSMTALLLACLMENGAWGLGADKISWWRAFEQYETAGKIIILGGAVFVLIFQVNITWLSALTSATTVGIVGGMKVVPQWGINSIFAVDNKKTFSWYVILGASCVMASSVFYAWSKFIKIEKEKKENEDKLNLRKGLLENRV